MKGLLLVATVLLSLTSFAQTWEWAHNFDGSIIMATPKIKSDGAGNSYSLQMNTGDELDVVKRNPQGDTIWHNKFIFDVGPSSSMYKLAVDDLGNSYIAIRYTAAQGNINYEGNIMTVPYSQGVLIAKLDPQGSLLWQQDIGNAAIMSLSGLSRSLDLELTANDDILFCLTAPSNSNFEVDNFNATVQGGGDAFYLKLSGVNGSLMSIKHAKSLGSSSHVSAASFIQTSDGEYCMVGSHFGLIDIDGTVISSDAFDPDFFVAKLDATGGLLWHKEISTDASDPFLIETMSVNPFSNGGFSITGSFEGYIASGAGVTYSSTGVTDCYAAKYTNDGDLLWAQAFNSPGQDYASESRIDDNDRLYFLASLSDSVLINNSWYTTGPEYESAGGLIKLNQLGDLMYFKSTNYDAWDSELGVKGINGVYIGGTMYTNDDPLQLDTISEDIVGFKFIGKIDESACGSDILPMPFNDSTICFGSSLTLEPDNSYAAYSWSNGETTPSISVSDSGAYYLTAYNTNGCAYTSEPILVNTAVNNIIPDICMVTVDDTSSHNIVVWDKPLTTTIDSFRIYRQAGSNYYHVGSRSYDSISQFIDTTVGINPNITSYRYKVSSVDLCGNESALSEFHETMHLTVNQGTQGEVNLIWDTYEGFPFQYYYIYRDLDDQNNWDLVDSVSFLNFTYTDFPPAADSAVSYMVEIKTPGLCSAVKAQDYNSSRSNKPRYGTEGDDVGLDEYSWSVAIYPNPANNNVVLEPGYDGRYSMTITNTIGAVLLERHELMGKENINVSNFSEGVYIINIFKKGRRFQKKLVVTR
tara:strand:+ start:22628 stop:25054 length:2427 start_codon:yes stop_codon:yes gene_type:complete